LNVNYDRSQKANTQNLTDLKEKKKKEHEHKKEQTLFVICSIKMDRIKDVKKRPTSVSRTRTQGPQTPGEDAQSDSTTQVPA